MWCLHCSALWSYVSAAWCSNFQLKYFSYRWWNWLSTGQIKYNILATLYARSFWVCVARADFSFEFCSWIFFLHQQKIRTDPASSTKGEKQTPASGSTSALTNFDTCTLRVSALAWAGLVYCHGYCWTAIYYKMPPKKKEQEKPLVEEVTG